MLIRIGSSVVCLNYYLHMRFIICLLELVVLLGLCGAEAILTLNVLY